MDRPSMLGRKSGANGIDMDPAEDQIRRQDASRRWPPPTHAGDDLVALLNKAAHPARPSGVPRSSGNENIG
jgi:hypothetical protein